MARWIILGGALVLGIGLAALATWHPEPLGGFSGLVIWIFLGYCGIIVVAQVGAAVRDVTMLARRMTATRVGAKLQRVHEGGKQ